MKKTNRYARAFKASKSKFASVFKEGDKVKAKSSVQGMTEGKTYTVTAVHSQDYPWGIVRNYILDNRLTIANGEFVLTKVSASRSGGKAQFASEPRWVSSDTARADSLMNRLQRIQSRANNALRVSQMTLRLIGGLEDAIGNALNNQDHNLLRHVEGKIRALESQQDSFSRPGGKARFGNADAMISLANGYISDGDDEAGSVLADLVRMDNRGMLSPDQKQTLKRLIRDARAMGVYSRSGGKAQFSDQWDASDERQAQVLIKDIEKLIKKCEGKRHDIYEIEVRKLPHILNDVKRAIADKNVNLLDQSRTLYLKADDIRRSFSRDGGKAQFGLERSISIMLSDAKIPDSAFDWRGGSLIVDPEYHDRIVEVLKGYIPSELKSLPRIRKEQMSRSAGKARFSDPIANKISLLMDEGKDRDQAVAIALDMKQRGEL